MNVTNDFYIMSKIKIKSFHEWSKENVKIYIKTYKYSIHDMKFNKNEKKIDVQLLTFIINLKDDVKT